MARQEARLCWRTNGTRLPRSRKRGLACSYWCGIREWHECTRLPDRKPVCAGAQTVPDCLARDLVSKLTRSTRFVVWVNLRFTSCRACYKTKIRPLALFLFYGTPDRIWTYDLLLRKQTLYPAELRAHTVWNYSSSSYNGIVLWGILQERTNSYHVSIYRPLGSPDIYVDVLKNSWHPPRN